MLAAYTTAIAAVDDDAYASAITDLRGAVTTGTEVAFEARALTKMRSERSGKMLDNLLILGSTTTLH